MSPFAPLPSSMSELELAVLALNKLSLQLPPPIIDLGPRLRLIYSEARKSGYTNLSSSELRKLPYAYWVGNEPPLTVTDPELVKQYWEIFLPNATQQTQRCANRWLIPLFYTYCEYFKQNDLEFEVYANHVKVLIKSLEGGVAEDMKKLDGKHNFFSPSDAPSTLSGNIFLTHGMSLDQLFDFHSLWPGFRSTLLGKATFRAALDLPSEIRKNFKTICLILEWLKKTGECIASTDLRVLFANRLLDQWTGDRPSEEIKRTLVTFFLNEYGDPRLPEYRYFQWVDVSDQAMKVFFNWLTGDTLRGFMNILRLTADEIWKYREAFWMDYYERGYIEEAWVALGSDAFNKAISLRVNGDGMGCGKLTGAAASSQSVLLLRIGNIIFTEWSHNGSLRAYDVNNPEAPELYKNQYSVEALKRLPSMDFHNGQNQLPQLRHSHSHLGSWQNTARRFIRHYTGV